MEKSDLRKGIEQGLGFFGIGLALFTLIIGVYAFVEPTNGPANNYVFDWSSPLNSMHNDTNQKVTAVQTTASGLSSNTGMYDNRIPDESFAAAYTEVCFKSGATQNDQHAGGESTAGGNCLPGDVGYIIEQNERTAEHWEDAKATCLENSMRLPESFEFKYSCDSAGTFGLSSMTGNWEWSSNFALPMYDTNYGVGAAILGNSGCGYAGWGWVGRADGSQPSYAFRCAK